MFALLSALALAVAPPPAKPVTLNHVFKLGQKMQYDVKSHLQTQVRGGDLETFIPFDRDLNYQFSMQVDKLKADGIALVHVLQPQETEIEGETADHGPITRINKLNEDLLLTMTPVNDVVEVKDQTKKPKGSGSLLLRTSGFVQAGAFLPFVNEIYALAMFQGAQMETGPRLPLDEVAVGDTWKRTVAYQPQKVKGKNEQAVQRLDYTFTYNGLDTWNGKKVQKVNAKLNLDTDVAAYFNQMMETTPEESGLKGIPLKLQASIDFYLDPVTMHTLAADGTSEGGFKLVLNNAPNAPVLEEKVNGSFSLRLVGVSQASPAK